MEKVIEIARTELKAIGKPTNKVEVKNPVGVIYLTLDKLEEKEGGIVAGMNAQIAGRAPILLAMLESLLQNLIKQFGDEVVVKVFQKVFAKRFDEMIKMADLATRVHEKKTKKGESNGELVN